MRLKDLVQRFGGELVGFGAGADDPEIQGIAPTEQAGPGELTFLTSPRYLPQLKTTRAAAVICSPKLTGVELPRWVHPNPYQAMAQVAQLFFSWRHSFGGQSPLAFVHPEASVDATATIYPFAFVDAGAKVGARTVLYPHVFVGSGSTIGEDSILFPGVSVMSGCSIGARAIIHAGAVLGADGFGFAPGKAGIAKIPQIGGVRVGQDVEIGACTAIDRGAFNDTVLHDGCKLDNHVQVAHGAEIGAETMLCGGASVAGSTKLGQRNVMAGHAATAPGVVLADNVRLGGKCGATGDIKEPGDYLGMPALPADQWRRMVTAQSRLPELLKRVKKLEQLLGEKGAQNDDAQ